MDESLSEDHLVKKLQHFEDNRFIDSPASTTRSLKAEIEELTFRPTISVIISSQIHNTLLRLQSVYIYIYHSIRINFFVTKHFYNTFTVFFPFIFKKLR